MLSFTAVEGFEPPALEFADADADDADIVEIVESD